MVVSITELPYHIMVDILSRLPIKTLLVCRCVCKKWLTFTTNNPHFLTLHTSNTPHTLIVQFQEHGWPLSFLYMINQEFDSLNEFDGKVKINPIVYLPERPKLNCYTRVRYPNKYDLINSCNGLLFLEEDWVGYQQSLLCNPITNEYILLPQSEKSKFGNAPSGVSSWLGYSPKSKHFKVLRIILKSHGIVEAEVYVLGSGFWRSVEDASLDFYISRKSRFAFLDGAIHWVCSNVEMSKFIVCFDFEKEKFGEIAAPSYFGEEHHKEKSRMNIGVLGGSLYVTDPTRDEHFDIWIMKEYGVGESWSKDYVVETGTLMSDFGGIERWNALLEVDLSREIRRMLNQRLYPLQVLGSGEILMIEVYKLLCYDPQKKSFRSLQFPKDTSDYQAVLFSPSFVSLKHILVDQGVKVLPLRSSDADLELEKEAKKLILADCTARLQSRRL